uniref:Uncharacterized protein n=1 Tax=Enterococcus phage PMBT56 TaxID=3229530 RepID=A0AB39C6E1_9CAUD
MAGHLVVRRSPKWITPPWVMFWPRRLPRLPSRV